MTTRSLHTFLATAAAGLALSALSGCFVRVGPPPPAEPAPAATPAPAPAATPAPATGPTEGTPINCKGPQELSNVVIKSPTTPLITAVTGCKLVLKNPTLQGPVAIVASGDAEVRIEGGSVTGVISASEKANVTMKGAKSTGPFNKTGQAVINVM